jgi:Arc/MetJ-type ribon-helix-helix transcriptional regulator
MQVKVGAFDAAAELVRYVLRLLGAQQVGERVRQVS